MTTKPPYKVDGKKFQTAKELAEWADVPYATMIYRLRNDWSPEKAAKTPIRTHDRSPPQIFEVDGKKFKTAKELSDWSGVPYATLKYRLKRGWSPIEAAKIPVMEMRRESWEVFGIEYPSLSAAAKAYEKEPENIRQRVYAGMSLEEALTLPHQLAKPITVHGERFPTRRAVAPAFGINQATFYGRLRAGYSPEEAVDKEIMAHRPMTYKGETYPSIGSAATAHSLPYSLVWKRKHMGWSDEDALSLPSGIGTEVTYGGKTYKTLKEACEVTGMDPRSASYRLRAGWDIESALDPNAEVDNRKSITINGQNYSTMSDAARAFELNETTFMKRLRSGWTPEQAAGIESPPEFQSGQAPIPTKEYLERLELVHGDDLNFARSDFGRAQEKIKVECNVDDRHPLFWATPNNLLRGRGCPICKASYGERAIYLWLERYSIEAIREWTDHGLSTSSDKRGRLRFDFYLPTQKALIEYDGHQHFEPVTFGVMSEEDALTAHERLKFNDAAKDEWAGENDYNLVRIRFDENIEDRLEKEFGG